MGIDQFKIYPERLRDGHVERLHEVFPPDFIDVKEQELRFEHSVDVEGEAYLADDNLIIHLDIATIALMPCAICNEASEVPLEIKDFYHMEPLNEIHGAVFDLTDLLRETLLLELPKVVECNHGHCPQRQEVGKYFKKCSAKNLADKDKNSDQEGYLPFADIDLEI